MKPSGVVLCVVFAAVALAVTVWVGRYRAEPPKLLTGGDKPVEVGPPIAPTGPYPKAVVDQTSHDFGVMPVGAEGKHEYVIRNEGDADLVLMARKEDTTCSCTFGELSKDGSLKPGESVSVTLQWKIRAPSPRFRHMALVRTNDPEHKTIELVVEGDVDEALRLLPGPTWQLGELSSSEPNVISGQLFSTVIDKFEIERHTTSRPTTKVEWTPMSPETLTSVKGKCGYEIKVTVPPDVPLGPFADNIRLMTDIAIGEEPKHEIAFEIKGMRAGPLEFIGAGFHAEANVLMMGEFPAAKGKEAVLSLFVRDLQEDLVLKDIKQQFNSVEISLQKDEKFAGKAQRYLLKIKVPPGAAQNRQRKNSEKIDLFLNHPGAPEVRLIVDFLAV